MPDHPPGTGGRASPWCLSQSSSPRKCRSHLGFSVVVVVFTTIFAEKEIFFHPPGNHELNREGPRIFRARPSLLRPNTGFPLPGHVMVSPQYGPGTERWTKYGMESREEYDAGLAERLGMEL